jgi:hypothetical protein
MQMGKNITKNSGLKKEVSAAAFPANNQSESDMTIIP